MAKIHYLGGNFNGADETLNLILKLPKYKDSYEVLQLLAKVKNLQGKRYEAMALYKRIIELNPNDYEACFDIAQMFDQIDQGIARTYYEQGLEKFKAINKERSTDESNNDPRNIVSPEILNNVGVLRLELATQQQHNNPEFAKAQAQESLRAFDEALENAEKLKSLESQQEKLEEQKEENA